jgi:hypothetical protein
VRYVLGRATAVVAAFALVLTLAMSNVGKAAAANLTRGAEPASAATAADWSVTAVPSDTESMLSPGSQPVLVEEEIVNSSPRSQVLNAVSASVTMSDGNVIDAATGESIRGCLADWFAVQTPRLTGDDRAPVSLPDEVAPGHAVTVSIPLSMVDSGSRQDACRGGRIQVSTSVG